MPRMAVPGTQLEVVRPLQGIDHVTISVTDYRAARKFYELTLRPLGFAVLLDWPDRGRAFLGLPGEPSTVWVAEGEHSGGVALSLAAPDRSAVDAFYAAALAAGGRTLSPPGIRPEYTRFAYGAEVLDQDGNSLQAVCRDGYDRSKSAA